MVATRPRHRPASIRHDRQRPGSSRRTRPSRGAPTAPTCFRCPLTASASRGSTGRRWLNWTAVPPRPRSASTPIARTRRPGTLPARASAVRTGAASWASGVITTGAVMTGGQSTVATLHGALAMSLTCRTGTEQIRWTRAARPGCSRPDGPPGLPARCSTSRPAQGCAGHRHGQMSSQRPGHAPRTGALPLAALAAAMLPAADLPPQRAAHGPARWRMAGMVRPEGSALRPLARLGPKAGPVALWPAWALREQV
jgi:hypothetical protein